MPETSTIAAFATPSGTSALAVLRVSGTLAQEIAAHAFGGKNPRPRRANFGKYILQSGQPADECVWTFFEGPASYTGEDMLEISCHGNPFISKRILADLFKRGCVPAQPGEFTRRAFLNGKMDLTQAEAVANIISASTERSSSAAMRLLDGEFRARILGWNDILLELIAETETQIDFSDEEIPDADDALFREKIKNLRAELKKTEDSARYSEKMNTGVNVAICGAPNAGKSSLLNAVVGFDRAIVSAEAGTTRDFINEKIEIGKHGINLVDTAGIRDADASEVEKAGILRAFKWSEKADLIVFVVDTAAPAPTLPPDFLKSARPEKTLVVFNKIDLPPAFDRTNFLREYESVEISLASRGAAETFKAKLVEILEKKDIVPPDDILVVSARHAECLRKAGEMLEEIERDGGNVPPEFVSAKLRDVSEDLAEILGKFDNEKVLDKIFSTFCIGK